MMNRPARHLPDLTTGMSRRSMLTGFGSATLLATSTLATTPTPASAQTRFGARQNVSGRPALTSGASTGDVTSTRATLWARADRPSRLVAVVHGPGRSRRRVDGPWAGPASDYTATIDLRDLLPGREYTVTVGFETDRGIRGQHTDVHLRTASTRPAAQSFVWTGDTCGQGWGINPDLGGLRAYRAMHQTRPDFFLHSGDTVYADSPISEQVTEPDGQVWRNLVTPEVSKVAETLGEFRGRHRYTLMDENVRAFYADVPLVAQWDDHETTNNWYPGEILSDERYTERRVDVLAARARQAFWEYQPIGRASRKSPGRIYRTIRRGAQLDLFCLDMRTFKSPNTDNLEPYRTPILGAEQTDWLIRGVTRSRARWKVIAADLPLGLIVPDGPGAQEAISNSSPSAPLGRELEIAQVLAAIRRAGVRNVVWLTADVHYCAAHHYDPSRAAFTDFNPFWEFVAGPIAAGSFGPNTLDPTFGPRADFIQTGAYPNASPRSLTGQFFGHVDIATDGVLTVSLRDGTGAVLYSRSLEPQIR
ncbi:MAG: alkaline phosphatase D family protein [Actinomycetales bacterium]